MIDAVDTIGARRDVVAIPILWLAIALSLLVHVGVLWLWWPNLRMLALDNGQPRESRTLAVQIAPRASAPRVAQAAPPAKPSPPPPAPAEPVPSQPEVRAQRPPVTPKRPPAAPVRRSTPPVLALDRAPTLQPLPTLPAPPPPFEPAPVPAPAVPAVPPPRATPPVEQDLAAYVAARRRDRGESPAPDANSAPKAESEYERRNRIVAANLGLERTPTFGYDPKTAGGIFQISQIGYDEAEFYFLGLDRDIGRNARQLVEVRRGDDRDIRVAIVRKMIAIIRENVTGDFWWNSQRLGRAVQMSARPSDNAELEAFILRDVFPDARPAP